MAVPNMIVTLSANVKGFSQGLKKASSEMTGFGKFVVNGAMLAAGAIIAIGASVARLIPDFVNLGLEGRKADARLRFMAENVLKLGEASKFTMERLAGYASSLQDATAVDDEFIKGIQGKLLSFKILADSAGITGGLIDRVTKASLDMSAVMGGDASTNAVKLARLLQNPIGKMDILARSGVVFTDVQKKQATAIQATSGDLEASLYLLGLVEDKFGGLAEKTADPLERIRLKFEDIGQEIGGKMLGAVDLLSQKITDWVNSPAGEAAIKRMSDAIGKFVGWITSSEGQKSIDSWITKFGDLAGLIGKIVDGILFITKSNFKIGESQGLLVNGFRNPQNVLPNNPTPPRTSGGARSSSAPVINFNAPVDSVSAGREVARVLADYARSNGGRR